MDELEHAVGGRSSIERWSSVSAVAQASEAADTLPEAMAKWEKIYRKFGARSEGEKDEAFAAVNLYFLRNGCSPFGKYNKPIRTAGGVEVLSGEVVKISGRLEGEIRQFLRGRIKDSYEFLKFNPASTDDDSLAAIAESVGVPRSSCWLLADWLGPSCPFFVGNEDEVYRSLRSGKIALAAGRRSQAGSARDRVMEHAPEVKAAQVHGVASGAGNAYSHESLF